MTSERRSASEFTVRRQMSREAFPGIELASDIDKGSSWAMGYGSVDAESRRDGLDVLRSFLWCGDTQHRLLAVEQDRPGHEGAALRLSGCKRLEFRRNFIPRLEPDLKFGSDLPGGGRGALDEPFPATQAFGSILQPKCAGGGAINAIR